MIKMMFLASVGVLGLTACAQQEKTGTPENVLNAFNEKFPTAKNVKWDKESETEWEAEFKMNGVEYSANFSSEGDWKETEHEIKKSEIPSAVKQTLDTEFAGFEIEESEIAEKTDGTIYEFELEKGEEVYEVAIDATGKVVKKEKLEEKGEEDED